MKITRLLFFIIPLLTVMSSCSTPDEQVAVDLPRIEKDSGNHLVHFSNKKGSFWSAESRKYNTHWSTGYVSHRERIFGDVSIFVDGKLLPRDESKIVFTPADFERRYDDETTERWFMPDGSDALVLQLEHHASASVQFRIDDLASYSNIAVDSLQVDSASVTTPLRHRLNRSMSIQFLGGTVTSAEVVDGSHLLIDIQPTANELTCIIQIGDGEPLMAPADIEDRRAEKRTRIETLASTSIFTSEDHRLNDVWIWALSSFDALNMDEDLTGLGKGIYAGYPWFQDYWGRDSFIALRALTVTGQYQLAADNLESFLKFQNMDSQSSDYGKIPNRVRPGEIIYNTADATPRFLIEADRYVAYSGDTAFARRVFSNIDAAIVGTIQNRTDSDALLKHGAADTWMDAVGPNGPYSPRGDRAVDIQALWIDALQAAANLARFTRGARADQVVAIANETRDRALESFQVLFRNNAADDPQSPNPYLYDAILPDGSASYQLRPNALFATHLVPGTQTKRDIIVQATNRLGTPWGISSLDPSDPKYLAYHKAEPLYDQDASYHNGIVWLWNSGIWIELLLRQGMVDKAWEVTRNYVDLMLDNITLGTLPELIDAKPREGVFATTYPDADQFTGISRLDQLSLRNEAGVADSIPSLSGTWSQAWSLSEFIRNITEDYVGLRYTLGDGFELRPQLPDAWGNVMAARTFAGYTLELRRVASQGNWTWLMRIEGSEKASPMPLRFMVPGMEHPVILELSGSEQRFEIRKSRGGVAIILNNEVIEPDPAPPSVWKE